MKPKKPLALTFEIDGYQEDQIVAVSLKQTYEDIVANKHGTYDWPEEKEAMLKSLRCVYHYYTGRRLK
jgi:hypothetical protein